MRTPILPVLVLAWPLVSCVGPKPTVREQAARGMGRVSMPVLRAPVLEKSWDMPRIETHADGGYRITYRQGTSLNYVFVHGLANPAPVPATPPDMQEDTFTDKGEPVSIHHKQSWRTTTIAGQKVKWYQNDAGGGADFPCYKTVDFALTAPDGRTGHYRVEVCAESETKAAEWIRMVGW